MKLSEMAVAAKAKLSESAKTPNKNARKLPGERKVQETDDYIIYYHSAIEEYRGVMKYGTQDDGAFEDNKADLIDTMNMATDRR